MKLSVLDQSPISAGSTAEQALQHTIRLAKETESFGFERIWVAEHHNTKNLASSSPEVLIPYICARTNRIKVGSGGVMLPHYSPYKVAENFKVMEALAPNRIDLGIGRAPGGMPLSTIALSNGGRQSINDYPHQIDDLLSYLHNDLSEDHPYYGLMATPDVKTAPNVWLLGSSLGTAKIAAEKGLPFCFAHFINGSYGPRAAEYYFSHFQPSPYLSEPKMMAAFHMICAETEEKAETLAQTVDRLLLSIQQGRRLERIPHPDDVPNQGYAFYEKEQVRENRNNRMIVGTPDKVKEELFEWQKKYHHSESMFVTITYDIEDKIESYRLIAEEML